MRTVKQLLKGLLKRTTKKDTRKTTHLRMTTSFTFRRLGGGA